MSPRQLVIIVDGDEASCLSTAALLEQADYRVRTFESAQAFFLAAPGLRDAVCLVLDMHIGGGGGTGLLRALDDWEDKPAVLVLTSEGKIAEAVAAMKLGAADFLEKPYLATAFLEALERALALGASRKGRAPDPKALAKVQSLTPRQLQVLRGVINGQPNKIIAYELALSIRTVEAYRAQLLARLGVRGTADVVRFAAAVGMLFQASWGTELSPVPPALRSTRSA